MTNPLLTRRAGYLASALALAVLVTAPVRADDKDPLIAKVNGVEVHQSDLVIAERGATFGLPEILFNLFPGMGAYTFLSRRIAPGLAERLIMSGEIYSAEQLHAMGVVDVLAAEGQGVSALYDFVGRGGRRHAAQLALYRARRLTRPLNFEEMAKIADLWVEAASTLDEAGLRKMHRLMDAQERRRLRRGGTF